MERRDAWGVAFVACFALGLVAASIAATVVRLPGGTYSMGGLGLIALAGVATWTITTTVVAAARMLDRRRRASRQRAVSLYGDPGP